MADVYQLWTVQIYRAAKLGEQSIHLLDTTAKSGVSAFAPAFSDVMAYKAGRLSKEQYTDIYVKRMIESRRDNPVEWFQLQDHKKVAVACYCAPGKFCHRHLFIKDHQAHLESLGHEVQLMGEFNGAPYYDTVPEAVVSVPIQRQIIPFYSKDDVLSNHHPSGFMVKGVTFPHVESFMMYCKAMLFKDTVTAAKILTTSNPQACKMLGRQVRPYDDVVWVKKRRSYVFIACLQKAREHPEIREYLLSTGNALLVEASARDVIWGVGIAKDDPRIYDINAWRGMNLSGEVWMQVRRVLQEEVVF